MNTQHDITVSGKPLNPPKPPAKPHMLLWIDTETTGISRTNAKLLEIGMIVTSMDGIEEHDRFICPVRPDHVSLYDLDPKVLRMHLDNGLLDTVMETEPEEFGYANVARNLGAFLDTEASQYVLHPAGTNVDYDIDVLTNQLGPHLHPDWLRQLTNHRKLDLSTYRISDLALDHNPYQNHAGTHRVQDCIRRDRNDYANYLDNGERPVTQTRLGACLASRKAYGAGATRNPTDREIDMAALAIYTGTSGMSVEEVLPLWPDMNPDAKVQYRRLARLAITAARTEALK